MVVTVWRALASPARRRLIELLRDGPRTTGELCGAFGTSRFAVMKHLRVLERAGVLDVRREGRKRWNSLNPGRLQAIGGRWAGLVTAAAPTGEAPPSGEGPEPGSRDDRPPGALFAIQVFIDAVPWKVFDALTVNVAAWWGPPHLRAEDASNLVIEPQPGGRFYEEWGHRQGAMRGMVAAIRQDERLELAGPIFESAGDARLGFQLESRERGTLLTITSHNVPAAAVDDLFRCRLKTFVEKGVRSGIAR